MARTTQTLPPFKKRGNGPGPRGIRKAKIAARVGAGLSLDKLAGAKKSGYDPRVAKEKERALNAGKVNKYRKMLKRMEGDEAAAQGAKKGKELAKPSGSDGSKPPSGAGQDAQGGAAGAEPGQAAAVAQQERGDRPGKKEKKQKKKKPKSKLEQLAAENEAESEAKKKAREERARAAAERRERLKAEQKRRKEAAKPHRKKTKHGQPLMKARLEGLLSKLEDKP